MWTLRRASNPLRSKGFTAASFSLACTHSPVLTGKLDGNPVCCEQRFVSFDGKLFSSTPTAASGMFVPMRNFNSHARTENRELNEDLFAELESPPKSGGAGNEDDSGSESDLSDLEDMDTQSSETILKSFGSFTDDEYTKPYDAKKSIPELFTTIKSIPVAAIEETLDKWAADGNSIESDEINETVYYLRRRRMFGRALQLSYWIETKKKNLTEKDYLSRLYLLGRVRGPEIAETFLEQQVPGEYRSELFYRTLLGIAVIASNVRKAEEIFKKMRILKYPLSTIACNQMILLYKRFDRRKIPELLQLMEKENTKPSLFTYALLIDVKGSANDIPKMEEIYETMKEEGIEPDIRIQTIMARHYAFRGYPAKAESLLKEMEGDTLQKQKWVCQSLIPIYAQMGNAAEVRRLWSLCSAEPTIGQYLAVIDAWGRLKNVEEAESVFNKMEEQYGSLSSSQYSALLKVYASNKMLEKGKQLAIRMAGDGVRMGPWVLDVFVKLHADAGEVEKADAMVAKAMQDNMKPRFTTFLTIMDHYGKKGDVHNAEKIFRKMKQTGYNTSIRCFGSLLNAYVNAKSPAYGMKERLIADGIYPNKAMTLQIEKIDPFRRNRFAQFLD